MPVDDDPDEYTAMAMKKGSRDAAGIAEHRKALEAALAELPRLVVASGECEYLRSRAAAAFRDAWLAKYPDGDMAFFRGAGEARPAGLQDVLGELSGGSLFAGNKLVAVRQADRILFPQAARGTGDGAGASGDREKSLIAWMENPSSGAWLFLESAGLPRNRILGKRLAEFAFLIPCPLPRPRDLPGFLAARARELGHRLDDAAADMLIRAHGADLGALAGEIGKLALYAGEGKDIDAGMVREFLVGTIEFDIFAFTNAIEARDGEQALYYARRIAGQGTRDQKGKREDGDRSAHKVIFMLASSLENLLRAAVIRGGGGSMGDFVSASGLSPWRAERVYQAAAAFGVRELRGMVEFAARQMSSSHDTGGDAALSLELMAVELTAGKS